MPEPFWITPENVPDWLTAAHAKRAGSRTCSKSPTPPPSRSADRRAVAVQIERADRPSELRARSVGYHSGY